MAGPRPFLFAHSHMTHDRSSRPFWLGEDERVWDHVRVHIQLMKDPRLAAAEIATYCGLAVHAELESGRSRPSLETLAEYTGLSPWRVREAIRSLQEAGYIETRKRPGKASIYRLLPPPDLPPETLAEMERRRLQHEEITEPDPSVTQRGTPATTAPHPRDHRATPPRPPRRTPLSDRGVVRDHRAPPPRSPRTTPAATAHEREPGTRTSPPPSSDARDVDAPGGATTDDRRRDVLEGCWQRLADLDLDRRRREKPDDPIVDPIAWRASAAARRRDAHELEAGEILDLRPDLGAHQLAEALTAGALGHDLAGPDRLRDRLRSQARNLAWSTDSAEELLEFLSPHIEGDDELGALVVATWHETRGVSPVP